MFPGKFTRYVLGDVLKMFLLMLISMTMVISLIFVGQQLVAEGVNTLTILKLFPYISLIALQYSVPATLLFAICCVYGRISATTKSSLSRVRAFRQCESFGLHGFSV